MTSYNSKVYWRGYLNETNYAGGSAGAAYAETEPANQAALTADNFPVNAAQRYPITEYEHIALRAAGLAGDVVSTGTQGLLVRPGTKNCYVQNTTWLDKVLANKDNEAAVPTGSWVEVFETGGGTYAAYGNFITEYKLSIPEGKGWPTETITYKPYSFKTATAGNFTSVPWATTTRKAKKDFVLTVDSVDYIIKSLTLTIVLKFDEDPGGGQYQNKYPNFQLFDLIEVEFKTALYDADHMLDFMTEAVDLSVITLAGWGKTLTLTDMKPKNDTLNVFEQPEAGTKYYTGTFEMGGDTNPTAA